MSRSHHRWVFALVLVFTLIIAACQPAATPTPTARPTTAPTATAEEVEVATEEAPEEEATEEADEGAATEEAEMEATEEGEAEATDEGTEVVMAPTDEAEMEATEEAEMEATEEAEMTATEEAEMEATEEAEMTATEEAEVEATEEAEGPEATMVPTDEAGDDALGGATITVSADGSVVIGLAAGLSGEGIAPLGIDIQRGAELALEDRPTVTVGGEEFTVVLDVQDDLCSADGGQAVANRFSADSGVVGVVGPMCSSACRSAAPIFDAAGFTTISPSCTAPDLTTSGFSSFNRAVVSDAFQGRIAAEYIFNVLGYTSIATIHDGSPYGEGLVNVVSERFTELGGEVVASDAVSVGDTDFRGLLDDIAQAEPELIYYGGFPAEAARLIEQRADAGLEDTPFMGADGIRGTEVIELSGESSEGVYATSAIPSSGEALTTFLTRYEEAYGEAPPAPYHANAYDAVNLFLDAVEATGTVEDGTLTIDRAALSDYIHSVSDFQGLTGVINAEGNGEMSVADIGIYQVTDGEFVLTHIGSVEGDEVVLEEAAEDGGAEGEATDEAEDEATEEAGEGEAEATPEATEAS